MASPQRRRLVLVAVTILGTLALSVQAGAAKVTEVPGWSPPPQTAVVDEGFAFAADPAAEQPEVQAYAPSPEASVEVPAEAAPAPAPEPNPCADALTWVEGIGLGLPPGVEYHCPSTQFAHHGAACWNASPCRGAAFIAINTDLMQGTSTAYLRHVVAHEVCHIIDFQTTGRTTEAGADACAAAHGAP